MTIPSIVIVSSSNTKPKSLIKLITKATEITQDNCDPHKISHQWKIDTKYYTANVNLFGISEHYVRTEEFNENVEALIVHMDSNKETGLEDLRKWENLEDDCEPDVKILLTNYCANDTKVSKARAIDWCLKRGYELVELYPTLPKSKEIDQEVIKEKFGVERVIEALETHVWSNLIMKDKNTIDKLSSSTETNKICNKETNEEVSLDKLLSDDGTDDFTELFSQLQMMKESLQSMPMRERKQCAEQMVTAFWRAIGGDEEEIADL